MSSILTQAMIFERYGPRLNTQQLAELLSIKPTTLYNQVSAGTCPIKTYVDQGKRWADYRDVAQHFEDMRATAA